MIRLKKDAETVEAQADNADADNTASDAEAAGDTDNDKSDNKKKDPRDAVIDELQDRVKRQMAEFDNYRKRTDKEKSAMFEMGASDVIKSYFLLLIILNVVLKQSRMKKRKHHLPKVWIWFTSRQ